MNEPLPVNFKMPTIKKFDGVGNPHEHIMVYHPSMMLIGANDIVMCMVLFFMIGGIAQRWFTELLSESIDTFYDMVMKFTTYFMR